MDNRPTYVLADGVMHEQQLGNSLRITFNNDGVLWCATVRRTDTPAGADKAEDARADARRFLDSATVMCAADDAAELIERARAAAVRARMHVNTTLVCLAHTMPADDLRALRCTLDDLRETLANIDKAHGNLLDVGARQLVSLTPAPDEIPVFGVHVPVSAVTKRTGEAGVFSPSPSASPVDWTHVDDDIFWTAVAQSVNWHDAQDQGQEG
jgi:hypothetical protein